MSFKPRELSQEHHAAIRLGLSPGVGPRIYQRLIDAFGSATEVLQVGFSRLQEVSGIGSQIAQQICDSAEANNLHELLDLATENNLEFLIRNEVGYPELLSQISDPPNFLLINGNVLPADGIAIAVVGSRHSTHYGTAQAERFGRALALAGFTVVSGLARGIDAAAHLGALKAGGRTIAVLGSGLLNIYPSEHANLAKQVAAQGAVISEYHPKQKPKSGAFPMRNRIITGLCLGTIIVEAAQRSGALISARLAMEQNREVFAIPGPVTSRMSRGCHRLIRDGAKLVESIDDVIDELGPLAVPTPSSGFQDQVRHPAELKLTDQELLVLNSIGLEPTQIDEVVVKTGLPVQRVLSTISVLEIRRLIRRESGTLVVRI